MLNANDRAAAVFARHGVRAVTDVTGFGLAGHLLEMLDASGAAAQLWTDKVPLYPGFADAVREQAFSTLHADNARAGRRVVGDLHEWLFDPQTGGGLIAGGRPQDRGGVLNRVCRAG